MQNIPEYLIWGMGILFSVVTLIPLSKYPHGIVRTMEFPRIQITGLCLFMIPLSLWLLDGSARWWAAGLFALIAAIQSLYIARFTPVWRPQSVQADEARMQDKDSHVSFVAANVKMSNRDYGPLLEVLKNSDPDLVMLIETDDAWIEAMQPLRDRYDTFIEQPHDNGYGLALYSKLSLFETDLRELLIDKIPSIRTGVTLRSGEQFRLYVIHPEPPIPTRDTEGRDSEIAVIGLEAKDDKLPAVVSGDLNDVAWSSTTRRFQRLSKLLDPRVGRGFFNTFDARYPVMRWPLDHLFHDPRFQLITLERLPKIGSDHFPILFKLALAEGRNAHDTPDDATQDEIEEVKEMAQSVQDEDREAIGSDWEKD